MDMLKRNLAPIHAAAWAEIDEEARQQLQPMLSARRFADVSGPFGWEHSCVPLGRLEFPAKQPEEEVIYGIHKVLPLVEAKIFFYVDPQELENLGRGAKDVNLDGLHKAARQLAAFEEKAIYHGFKPAGISGIYDELEAQPVPLELEVESCIDAVCEAQARLTKAGVTGKAALVVHEALWKFLARNTQGGPLNQIIEQQIGGPVIYSESCNGALLVSLRGGDIELTIGQDICIGYELQDAQGLKLFLAESFTSRVINPEAIVALELRS